MREELERRTKWLGSSIQPDFERAFAAGYMAPLTSLVERTKEHSGVLGLAVYDDHGELLTASGPSAVLQSLVQAPIQKSLRKGADIAAFGHEGDMQWLQEAFPLHNGNSLRGALVLVADAGYIRNQGNELWWRSFWRILALVILIAAITFVMVRWFLMQPVTRIAERLRRLRLGHVDHAGSDKPEGLGIFTPLGARNGNHGGEPDGGARRGRDGSPIARCGRKPVDRRTTGGAYAGAFRFQPDFRGVESRTLHARAPGTGDRVRSSAQRAGYGH